MTSLPVHYVVVLSSTEINDKSNNYRNKMIFTCVPTSLDVYFNTAERKIFISRDKSYYGNDYVVVGKDSNDWVVVPCDCAPGV